MTKPPAIDIGDELFIIDRTPTRRGAHVVELSNGHGLYSNEARLSREAERQDWVVGAKRAHPAMNEARALEALQTLDFVVTQPQGNTDDAGDGGDADGAESQATTLVRLAADWYLFHDSDGVPYVTLPGSAGELQTHRLSSRAARLALQRAYHQDKGHVPRAQAVQDALGVLAGKAIFDGMMHEVHVRVAAHDGALFLDLGDESWRAIKVRHDGWGIVPSTALPIKFRRPKGLLALPCPVQGGSITDLRPFLNVKADADGHLDTAWVLIVGFLVGTLNPRGPYPILNVHGEQGSAKSTTLRVLRACIDPSSVPLRSQPREERDLLLDAINGWLLAIDNVSHMPDQLSDCMCRLSTGGGSSTRELYSDSEQTLFAAQRPCMTDGIEEYASRQDYLDRSLVVTQPPISDDGRKSERTFWQEFEQARPRILGALLTAASRALRDEATVTMASLPRMADFAIWVTAAEPALGWPRGTFMLAYTANRKDATELALEASVLAPTVRAFAENAGTWEGTAGELLQALNGQAAEATRKQRGWPGKPHTLSGALRRLAPSLRAVGVSVDFFKGPRPKQQRLIKVVWQKTAQASVPSVPRGEQASPEASPQQGQASPGHTERPHFDAWGDAGDAGDACAGDASSPRGTCSDCGTPIARAFGRCGECLRAAYEALDEECPI